MRAGKAFFDTNILLYMYGGADESRSLRAREVFSEYARAGEMLLSTQVVQEFYAAGCRKLGMARRTVQEIADSLLDLPLVVVGPEHIRAAIRIENRYRITFWDALIVAAAESGGAALLLTEDLNHGQTYGPVTVRNPFRIS